MRVCMYVCVCMCMYVLYIYIYQSISSPLIHPSLLSSPLASLLRVILVISLMFTFSTFSLSSVILPLSPSTSLFFVASPLLFRRLFSPYLSSAPSLLSPFLFTTFAFIQASAALHFTYPSKYSNGHSV